MVEQKMVIVYGSDYVQNNGTLGMRNIVKELAQLKTLQVALYGEAAENAKIFFGEKSIITASSAGELSAKLSGKLAIAPASVLFIGTKKDIAESGVAFKDCGRIAPTGIISLDAATSVTALVNSEQSREVLNEFNKGLAEEKIIDADTAKGIEGAIASLAKGLEGFALTVKTTEAVASQTEKISKEAKDFWDQI